MDYITELFCTLDDFCNKFNAELEKALIADAKKRQRKSKLSLSEAMTIIILFHKSGFRFFKYFYCHMVCPFWKSAFPHLVSYNRFVEIMPSCLQALTTFFHQIKGQDKALLSKRGLIETVNDQLKNLHHIEHSRHRSVFNFMVNIMAAVVAYCLSPNKPNFQRMIKI